MCAVKLAGNRHQRRRAQSDHRRTSKLAEGIKHLSRSGPMDLTIIPASRVLDPLLDPEILLGLIEFASNIYQGGRPRCLTCDLTWLLDTPPPAAFAVMSTSEFFRDRNSSAVEMISGICTSCGSHPDLVQRCLDSYRDIWPKLSAHVVHHDAPSEVQ